MTCKGQFQREKKNVIRRYLHTNFLILREIALFTLNCLYKSLVCEAKSRGITLENAVFQASEFPFAFGMTSRRGRH